MKRATFVLFCLIILALSWPSQVQASLKLFVGEDEVQLQHPLSMINGNFMIPLWVMEQHLGAKLNISSTGNIQVVFPDQTIIMQLDQESAQVNGVTHKLDVAPQISAGEIVIPVRFIADQLGLSLVFVQDLMALVLEPPRAFSDGLAKNLEIEETPTNLASQVDPGELPADSIVIHGPQEETSLREIVFMGGSRSRVFIDLESYTGYQTNLLTNPDRLVIDLLGVHGEPLPPVDVDDPLVTRIRSSRFNDQTMRIVFDLKTSTGYQVTPWPEGGLEVEFNYLLTSIGLDEREGTPYLHFESTDAPTFEMVYLESPSRLVLDFLDTTLVGGAKDVPVNLEHIQRLRVSQHLPSTTRVVLELKKPVAPLALAEDGEGRFILPFFAGTPQEAKAYLTKLAAVQPEPKAEPEIQKPLKEGPLSGLVIAVDPGHGGSDPGAIGYQGTFEKDVVLEISLYLGEFLARAGAEVVYTRDRDVYVSIFERPEIASKAGAHLFVSVHVNSHIEKGVARGTETLYRAKDPVSQVLARSVQDELVKAITLIDRRIWARDDLAIFNGTDIPAILVEVGFLDHPDEEVLLRAPGFQKVAAEGIYKGIERFYLENKR